MTMWWRKKKVEAPPVLVAEDMFCPGEPGTLIGDSPVTKYGAVFEDDGETGYFYGLDTTIQDSPILDALHVYDVQAVTDRAQESKFQIVWSGDGTKVALFINEYAHAVFDFTVGRGYCRTNFPPPLSTGFSAAGHSWDDKVLKYFG